MIMIVMVIVILILIMTMKMMMIPIMIITMIMTMVIIMILIMIPITIIIVIMTIIMIMRMIIVMIVVVIVIMIMIVKTIMIMIEQNSMQGGHYAKGLIYCRPIYQLPKLAFLSARAIPSENIFYNDGDNDSNGDNDNDDDSDNGNGNDSDIKQFSLSEQPLITSFGKLSYGNEILQRQRVVRQRTERGIRVAEGEVGGSKNITRLRRALLVDRRY